MLYAMSILSHLLDRSNGKGIFQYQQIIVKDVLMIVYIYFVI
jgi:hypothetical protein